MLAFGVFFLLVRAGECMTKPGDADVTDNKPEIRWAGRDGTTLVLSSGIALSVGGLWLIVSQLRAHDYDLLRWLFVLAVGLTALALGGRDQWNTSKLKRDGVETDARVLDRWVKDDRHFIALEVTLPDGEKKCFQGEVSQETHTLSKPEAGWRVRVLPSDPRVMKLVRAA